MMPSTINLKEAWSQVPTGVGVLCTRVAEGRIHGITVNSYISISVDHPMIGVSISINSNSHDLIKKNREFGFSILSKDQKNVANYFSSDKEFSLPKNIQFDDLGGNAYGIQNATVQFACSLRDDFFLTDHTLFVATIKNVRFNRIQPLIWHRSGFSELTTRR